MKNKYRVIITDKTNKHYSHEIPFTSWEDTTLYVKAILDAMSVIKCQIMLDIICLNTGEVLLTNDESRANHMWSGAIVKYAAYNNKYTEMIDFDSWSDDKCEW